MNVEKITLIPSLQKQGMINQIGCWLRSNARSATHVADFSTTRIFKTVI